MFTINHYFPKLSIHLLKRLALLVIGVAIFLTCSFEGIVHTESSSLSTVCGASCQPHTQAEQTQTKLPEQDKKDPIPPFDLMPQSTLSLTLFYAASLYLTFFVISKNKVFLLHSTLRF